MGQPVPHLYREDGEGGVGEHRPASAVLHVSGTAQCFFTGQCPHLALQAEAQLQPLVQPRLLVCQGSQQDTVNMVQCIVVFIISLVMDHVLIHLKEKH